MGVLIIIGTAIVGYTIVQRRSSANGGADATAAAAVPGKSPMSFGEVMAKLPADVVVEEMVGEGDRLMVRVRDADASQSILIFDLNSGRRLGVIHLTE